MKVISNNIANNLRFGW
ncbi:MAG: hypothetical protein ACOYIN_00495 [Christensenellales bacterium]